MSRGGGSGVRVYCRWRDEPSPGLSVDGTRVLCGKDVTGTEFDGVFGSGDGNNEVFHASCVPVLDGCLSGKYPKGGFGAIVAYGTQGAGKTHCMLRPDDLSDGVAMRCCSYLFSRGASVLKLQACDITNDICSDLLGRISAPRAGSVRVSVEDRLGALVEGAVTEVCRSPDGARRVIETALSKKPWSPYSHFVLIATVLKGTTPCGRLFLVDCAHCSQHPTVGKSQKEVEAQQTLSNAHLVLSQCLSGMASNRDYRVLPFRDSKITRLLQHPLYYAMHGQGGVALLTFFAGSGGDPEDEAALLMWANIASGRRAVLKTISEYKDTIEELGSLIAENDEKLGYLEGNVKATSNLHRIRLKGLTELEAKAEGTNAERAKRMSNLRKQVKRQHKKAEAAHMDALREERAKGRKALVVAQRMIDGADDAVDAAVKMFQEEHEGVRKEYRRRIDRQIAKEKEANDRAAFEVGSLRRQAEKLQAWERRVDAEVEKLTSEKIVLEEKMQQASGPSRTEGLTPDEVAAKQEYFNLLDQIHDFEEDNSALRVQVSVLKKATGMDVTDSETDSESAPSSPDTSPPSTPPSTPAADKDDASDADPTSALIVTPVPDKKARRRKHSHSLAVRHDDNDDDDDDATASVGSSTSSSSSSVISLVSEGSRDIGHDSHTLAVEREQLQFTLKREQNLHILVEQIMQYLEFGTVVTVVDPNKATELLAKRFAFIPTDRRREAVDICPVDASTGQPADRTKLLQRVPVREIRDIELGQWSAPFASTRTITGARPPKADPVHTPPTSQGLHSDPSSISDYCYRSLTIHLRTGASLALIAETELDFEAWVVALHRMTFLIPRWGTPLDVSRHTGYQKLSDPERQFCSENHITPYNYLNSRYQILNRKRFLTTLYDVRTASSLDLMHSQKLFELLCKTGHIEKTILWVVQGSDPTAATTAAATITSSTDVEGGEGEGEGEGRQITPITNHAQSPPGTPPPVSPLGSPATSPGQEPPRNSGLINKERTKLLRKGAGAAL